MTQPEDPNDSLTGFEPPGYVPPPKPQPPVQQPPPAYPPQQGYPQQGYPQQGFPAYGAQPPWVQPTPPPWGQPVYGQPPATPGYGYPQQGYGYPPGYGVPPGYGYPPPGMAPAPPPPVYGYWQGTALSAIPSMWARLGGLVLDWIVLAVPIAVLEALWSSFTTSQCDASIDSCSGLYTVDSQTIGNLAYLLLGALYCAALVGRSGQTVGHRAVGIRVVDVDTGGPIGPWRSAWRWVVLLLSGALCTLGFWSPLFNPERRGWHDMASRSRVVRSR